MPHRGNLARSLRVCSAARALSSGMASPHLLRASPSAQHRCGEPGRWENHRIWGRTQAMPRSANPTARSARIPPPGL
jgi:hypothetical protein